MQSNKLVLTMTLVAMFFSPRVEARELNQVELFRRCYFQFTGMALKATDPRIGQIKSGSLDPVTACLTILDKGKINPADSEGKLYNPTDSEGLAVLRRFYKVFSGFISTPSARSSLANFFEDFPSTEDVYDFSATALALTENTLNPNRSFKDIFSITKTPWARRSIDTSVTYPFTLAYLYGSSYSTTTNVMSPRTRHGQNFSPAGTSPDTAPYSLLFYGSGSTLIHDPQNFATVEVGDLIGIHYNAPVQLVTPSDPARTDFNGLPFGFDMNSTLFKGVPFLRTYLLANTNFNSVRPNLAVMPRRLSRNILSDFLCRDLPLIRAADALPFVSTDPNANPFRKGATCARCHATIDQMAGTYRGLGYISAGNFDPSYLARYSFHAQKSLPVAGTAAEVGWPAVPDANFYKRPATGRLFIRNLSGQLLNIPLASGDDLSANLANLDDTYACEARKLFQYMTGVKVDLIDVYDPDQADRLSAMSPKDWEYRNLVIQLGKNLKKHQKIRLTLEEILRLDIYRQSDFGAGAL